MAEALLHPPLCVFEACLLTRRRNSASDTPPVTRTRARLVQQLDKPGIVGEQKAIMIISINDADDHGNSLSITRDNYW